MVQERRVRSASSVRKPGAGFINKSMLVPRPTTSPHCSTLIKPVPRYGRAKEISLSLSDIVHVSDQERRSHSAKSRREMVTMARQSLTERGGNGRSGDISRPHTSASRYTNAHGQDSVTPKSGRSVRTPLRGNFVGETEFEVEPGCHSMVNSTSPAPFCCEIIGSQVCRSCSRLQREQEVMFNYENSFRTLRMTNDNILACAVVQQHQPNTSREEIQDKIARGEVCRNGFLKRYFGNSSNYDNHRERERYANSLAQKRAEQDAKIKKRMQQLSQIYFYNIRDLNSKITSGKIGKSDGFSKDNTPKSKWKRLVTKAADPLFPLFVSPKNVEDIKEPEYKVYFEPPLVPKRKQIFEPPFFAGSKNSYSLPDRLPEELRFVQNKNTPRLKGQEERQNETITSIIEEEEEEDC